MKLSVCMQVHNEEKILDDCLSGLHFADEIVIALDKSTDGSKAIAEKHGAVIVEGNWPLEGERRDSAFKAASGDWLLEIDADERVPVELAQEIRQVIETSQYDLHRIPFDNYIGDHLVKYGWGAYIGVSNKVALFRKGAKTHEVNGPTTHPTPIIHGKFGSNLKYAITHFLDDDLTDTFRRFDNYTNAAAKDLIRKQEAGGDIGSFGRNFIRLFSRFYKSYIRRKGYREGSIGFLIGVLAGLYPMVSYIKAKYRI